VIYLVFNEGHQATESPSLQRADLAAEAVRLARLLVALVPDDPESAGLLALLLVTHARRAARIGDGGALVPLETQDRSLWDRAAIAEGTRILDEVLLARRPGPFQVQAAISALHGTAPSWDETDWRQIAALYGALLRHDDSPVVELNRAVAVSMVEGPQAGLTLLARLGASPQMASYQPFHAARADLLRRAGRAEEGDAAYEKAIVLSRNAAERRFLEERRRSCRAAGSAGDPAS
jgi:RNA polymerase sigma-70 factor (ECF subfamily)